MPRAAGHRTADRRTKNPGPSRRRVLAMLSAGGAAALLAPHLALAQASESSPRIIDVHHHIYPPNYTKVNYQRLVDDSPLFPGDRYLKWTPRVSLDQMDQNGVATAIASMTSPGVWWGNNELGRRWARECNEYGATIGQDNPGRFGMFAAIPLPDPDGSLREIEYALDTLKLDGIGLLSSYVGRLLGDRDFAPVFDELNRRKTVVFVHPTMSCCGNLVPRVNAPVIEFPTDTTRTITSLVYSGTLARCPDIRFIFPHGGGTMPMITSRIAGVANGFTAEERAALLPHGLEYELRKLHYDTASILSNPSAVAAVLKLVAPTQLLFGSDQPFGSLAQAKLIREIGLPQDAVRAVQRENAAGLFTRFSASWHPTLNRQRAAKT